MKKDDENRGHLERLEQKLQWAQESQAVAVRILNLLNNRIAASDAIREILGIVKELTGFEAVGIRLRDGDDYPYFETQGFPGCFVDAENSLCARNEEGEIIRNSTGYPIMECMCGNILQGRTDPSLPFFTQGGSFWTNCTTELLATTTEQERQARTRNRCNGEGYESVALVPLRSGSEIIGLLQLNDSRKNCFTSDMIKFFEGIGAGIGIVLSHKKAVQERDRLFNLSIDMLAIVGFDGFCKEVNPAFTKSLGWTKEELLSKPWIEFVHLDDRDRSFAAGESLKSGEPLHQFRNRCQHRDGTYRWISWDSFPVCDEQMIYAVARDVTDRKQMEEALSNAKEELQKRSKEAIQESEHRYRSLFTNMLDGFAYCRMLFENGEPQDFVYLDVNDAFERLTGMRDVVGKRITELIPGINESNPEVFEIYGRVALTGIPEKFEAYVKPLGIWFSVSVYSPKSEHFIAVFDNITKRKRSEERLQEYERVVEGLEEMIVVVDRDYRYVIANRKFLDYRGLDREQLIGHPASEILNKKVFEDVVKEKLDECFQGKTVKYELRYKYPNLGERDLSISYFPIEGPTGVDRVACVLHDVTKRKQAEEARRESEQRFRQVFEQGPLGVAMLDLDYRWLSVNPKLCEMLGYEQDELTRLTVVDVTHPEDMEADFGQHKKALQGEIPVKKMEKRYIKKTGEVVWARLTSTLIRDEQGKATHFLAMMEDITEQKRAEYDLRISERKYKDLFEAAPVGIFQSTVDGRVLGVNPAYAKMFGYASAGEAALQIDNVAERIYVEPDRRNMLIDLALETGDFVKGENKYRREDGSQFWGQLYFRVVRDGDGEVKHLEGFVEDITDRKVAVDALRESQQKYRMIFEHAPLGILHFDNSGVMLDFNDKFVEMIGAPREKLIGFNMPERQKDERMRQAVLEALSGTTSYYEGDYLSVTGGKLTPMRASYSPVLSDDGKIRGGVGIFEDISKRKRLEEAQRRLATAVEQTAEAIVITDTTGEIQYVNPAFGKITGYTPEEVVGQNPRMLKSGEHDPTFYKNLWETITRGDVWTGRITNKRKDGSQYYEEATISPVRDRDGQIINFVAVKRDITQHLELSRQLAHAQKMEAVGTLAGGIAHDFNNLLQVVLGYSDLLLAEKREDDPEYADLLKILQSARSGAELVQRLLTFSRKVEPKPLPLNLNRQIIQVEKLLRRTIPKMIDIQIRLSDNLTKIIADPTQIEQILMNLAVNARDAMPENGTLTVATANMTLDEEYCRSHAEAKPGEYVLLTVSDTGHGMENETLEHMFEPFYTTKELGRGTGLGLATVYGIVKQHGGYITCCSEVGQGTTFNLYFPAIEDQIVTDVAKSSEMPAFGTETILLVDDEEFVRDLGARILSKAGYKVLTATNGKEALDLFEKTSTQISLVVLDVIMPEMGGKECLKELRRINPQLKVLIASGLSADPYTKESVEMGTRGSVSKPFRMKELLQQVRKLLDSD